MRFHHSTINRLWNLLRCNFLNCNHFRDASMNHSLARHGWCHGSFPIFSSHFWEFLCNLGHQDHWSKFLSVFEHYRFLASHFSILVSLDSERLYQFWCILLAIHDLVWKSFELLSISRTTYILWEGFSHNRVNFVKPFQESDKHLFESTVHRLVSLAWRPNQLWVDLVTSMYFSGIGNVSSFGT